MLTLFYWSLEDFFDKKTMTGYNLVNIKLSFESPQNLTLVCVILVYLLLSPFLLRSFLSIDIKSVRRINYNFLVLR